MSTSGPIGSILIEPKGGGQFRSKRPKTGRKRTSGLWTLRNTLYQLGSRVIDKRTSVGRALDAWRNELIADLGGEDNVSTQQRALVDLAVKAKLLLDSVDAWLLAQESLVTAKTKSLIPALRQRVTLAHTLERHLLVLGIHRRPKTLSLTELLAKDNTE